MKPKLILCLALVLSGGLFCQFAAAQGPGKTAPPAAKDAYVATQLAKLFAGAPVRVVLGRAFNNWLLVDVSAVDAKALANIGDQQSLVAIKQACDYICNYPDNSSFAVHDLFQAYHALAMLGDKQKARDELRQYSIKHWNKMEADARQEFESLFTEAKNW